MNLLLRPRTLLLFVGDILIFTLSLWLSLFLRTFELPNRELLLTHLTPFSILFIVWVAVFFIAGLYENRFIILARRTIGTTLLVTQVFNIILAALFFFVFVPIFEITPKTLLSIYLATSFLLVLFWRVVLFPLLFQKAEEAIVVGEGPEINELLRALHRAPHAPARVVLHLSPSDSLERELVEAIEKHQPRFVIADFNDRRIAGSLPALINFLPHGVRFIDAMGLYEEVLGRVALTRIDVSWIARNVSRYAHTLYDPVKRAMDITVALPAAVLSLFLYPFVMLAIIVESGFPVFIVQKRVGQDGRIIYLHKFRSMERNDMELSTRAADNRVTRVGRVIRTTRLDELPQLWDIVRGELSLIGPRPELPAGVALYEQEIPYYGVRHLIKPGLSGWAQLYHDNHPHHAAQVEATREKLSYDLYYLKHRSLTLDAVIALKTIKKLLSRSGV